MSARHKQISERAGHEQAMRVLFETAVAHLGEAKHSLNDADRMLDFGAHLQFGPVFRPLDLVHDTAVAIAAVDEVLCSRCVLTDHHPLARDTLGRPTREFRCRVADRAAPCCRRHWPASLPPRGSACWGCRPRNAPSSRCAIVVEFQCVTRKGATFRTIPALCDISGLRPRLAPQATP